MMTIGIGDVLVSLILVLAAIVLDFGVFKRNRSDDLIFWVHIIKDFVWIAGLSVLAPLLAWLAVGEVIALAVGASYSIVVHTVAYIYPQLHTSYIARRAWREVMNER